MTEEGESDQSNEPSQGLYLFAFLFAFGVMIYTILTRGNFLF